MPSQPTNVFTGVDLVGGREDLLDMIKNISPTERPFLSGVRTGPRATALKVEWQTDVLAAAADNAQLDGQDFSSPGTTATVRLGNYLQTLSKDVVIAGIVDSLNKAGRRSEINYQVTKLSKELLNDLEHALTRNYASTAGASASARHMASTESWIATSVQKAGGADGTTKGWQSGITTAPADSSTTGAISTTLLKGAISDAWTQGGNPRMILVDAFNKEKISDFPGIATLYKDITNKATIFDAADVYKSNFGEHMIVPSRFNRGRTVQVLDMQCWEVRYHRRITPIVIGKTGDSLKRKIVLDATLISLQEAASSKIADLSTS